MAYEKLFAEFNYIHAYFLFSQQKKFLALGIIKTKNFKEPKKTPENMWQMFSAHTSIPCC